MDELCDHFLLKKDGKMNGQKARLLAYIHEHFCEYSICLAELKDISGLSVHQIEQVLREETGMTYKEYLTKLRIEEAKRLLAGGMNVTETSNTVSYMSVSFFIKPSSATRA